MSQAHPPEQIWNLLSPLESMASGFTQRHYASRHNSPSACRLMSCENSLLRYEYEKEGENEWEEKQKADL